MSGLKADSGAKFDQGGIHRILTLVIDLNNEELDFLFQALQREKIKRNNTKGNNQETIKV